MKVRNPFVTGVCLFLALCSGTAEGGMMVQRLRCEYASNPLAVQAPQPRLSWTLQSDERGQHQTAYRVIVASTPEILGRDQGDVWDSGKVASPQSLNIVYAGRALTGGARYHWKVRVWDSLGKPSPWSAPAFWQMGLLSKEDWAGALWIQGAQAPATAPLLQKWIWHPEQSEAHNSEVYFRRVVELPSEAEGLILEISADDAYRLYANGRRIGSGNDWKDRTHHVLRIGEELEPGKNTIGIIAGNKGTDARGMICGIRILSGTADPLDPMAWQCATQHHEDWLSPGFDASNWDAPALIASYGEAPWGKLKAVAPQPLPIFRREFSVSKAVTRATAHICGLGQYELRLNGAKVGDNVMDPGWTDYKDTCLYSTCDVTAQLRQGSNALGVLLGNGMYNVEGGRYTKFKGSFGPPKLVFLLRIQYEDGGIEEVISDTSWKVTDGPIRFSCIYGGEDYDARKEQPGWDQTGFEDSSWKAAVGTAGPGGALVSQAAPPIKVMGTFDVATITTPREGVYVYDFGQNASGMPRLTVRGAAGAEVRLTPAEKLGGDGTVDQRSVGSPSFFAYTLRGDGSETWSPRFMYTGFRYVQVEGATPAARAAGKDLPVVEDLKMCFTRNSAERTGSFTCSNELFNRIDTLIDWAVMSNMQSVLTDCPHREKLGWLEEAHLMLPPIMYSFDIPMLLEKIARDMRNTQLPNGMMPDIAPEYVVFSGGFRESAEWGSTCVILPWYAYQWFGDRRILEANYEMMCRYVAYLRETSTGLIAKPGLGDWYDYIAGERPGSSKLTPTTLTATAIFQYDAAILAKVARLLGHEGDAEVYGRLAEDIRKAFNREYFHPDTDQYAEGSQTANAMALYMGLVPEERRGKVLDNLVKDVLAKWQTAGDVGHRYLIRALAEGGRSDVVHAMTNRRDLPGYGAILETGATSLTEAWDAQPSSSLNHFMLGHIREWFQQELAGIRPDPKGPGFKWFVIQPHVVDGLTGASGHYDSVHGRIESAWGVEEGKLTLNVTIPVNTTATVHVPTAQAEAVVESGVPAKQAPGVTVVRAKEGTVILRVGSGSYAFQAPMP